MSQSVLKAENLVTFLNNKFKTNIEVEKSAIMERKEFIFNNIDTINEEEGSVYCTISTEDVDRGGDMMIAAGMDITDFKKIPSVFVNHDYSLLPVAKCTEIHYLDKSIVAKIVFCREVPAIKNVWELVKSGVLKGVSIGFEAVKVIQKGSKEFNSYVKEQGIMASEGLKRIIPAWKMYEFSIVSIPMNQDCYIKSLTEAKIEVSEDLGKVLGFEKIPSAKIIEKQTEEILKILDAPMNIEVKEEIEKMADNPSLPQNALPEGCSCDKCDSKECKCSGKECKIEGCTCGCHVKSAEVVPIVPVVLETPKAIEPIVERYIHVDPKRHLITCRTAEDVKEFIDLAVKTRISGRKSIL